MTSSELGALKRLDPRDVWKSEPQDFTPWLEENVALLGRALDIEVEIDQREQAVGSFAVDLFGKETGTGRKIVIENQLATTNHDHLGKLLTYAAGLDAGIVIWVAPSFRDEHRQAVEWLNHQTGDDVAFFAVQVEPLQVDDSRPAPNFNVVAKPSESLPPGGTGKDKSPRRQAYHEFWTDLLTRLAARDPGFTTRRKGVYDNWIGLPTGRVGFGFNPAFVSGSRFRVELYIDTGEHDVNKSAFDQLHGARAEIESALDDVLTWERLDNRRACRVYAHRNGGIDSPPDELDDFKDWAVDRLLKFRQIFSPRLQALDLEAPSEPEVAPEEPEEVTP